MKGIKLANPMGADTEYLRDNLTNSLQKVLIENSKQADKFFLFEMASIYLRSKNTQPTKKDLPKEINTLGVGFYGYTFPDAVEIIKTLLTNLGLTYTIQATPSGLNFLVGKNIIGNISLVNNNIIANFTVTTLYANQQVKAYQPTNPNPPQIEDLKFEIAPKVYMGEVIEAIRKIENVTKVELLDRFDQYVTFRIYYQSAEKTLTDKEVARIRQKLTDLLSTKFAFKYQA
jgi:phenylalanyl-tRNA synthetase beta subunit